MIQISLNDAQQEAVTAPLGHQLILAGAGSGKTRVLTQRIAWLVEKENISPFNILAVTFTNKAAHEMRHRIESLIQVPVKTMWIGTFHGISHRLLRAHYQEAGLPQAFQILDSDDQQRLIRRVIQSLNLDEDRYPAKESQWFINNQKEEGRTPADVNPYDAAGQTQLKIYQAYEEACQRAGVIDFTDLLLKSYRLLQNNAELRAHYQEKFKCILVDEFQDTNAIQYAWLKQLAGSNSSVMIVGDDDQSIYGWRGAKIENIHRFSRDFANANVIRLEQNYRSTGTILKAANALIDKNTGRMGKNLWTDGKDGEPITVYAAFNETDEAFFIVNRIRELMQTDFNLREMAILYRSNAQSRVLEEALMQFGLPYRIYGGLRYFDRAEIKDALAYLRLIMNRADDPAFERIINTPTRGIGDRTLMFIRDHARNNVIPLWEALTQLIDQKQFATRAETALISFVNLINTMSERTLTLQLHKQVEYIVYASGLIEHFRKEKGEKGLTRIENLEELVNAAHQFHQEGVDDDIPPLAAFLAYAALESTDDKNNDDNAVQLMTLHSAKGLEFPIVFLAGCEEELFPHFLTMHDPKGLEEERRLCYVGVTRAMKKLFMTYAEVRRMHGKEVYHRPSRFLHEIPETLLHTIRFRTKVSRPAASSSSSSYASSRSSTPVSSFTPEAEGAFRVGQEVHHRIFGEGVVLDCEGDGENMKVKVRFANVGTKILLAGYLA